MELYKQHNKTVLNYNSKYKYPWIYTIMDEWMNENRQISGEKNSKSLIRYSITSTSSVWDALYDFLFKNAVWKWGECKIAVGKTDKYDLS